MSSFNLFWIVFHKYQSWFDHMPYFKWNIQSRNRYFNNKIKRIWGTGFHAFDYLRHLTICPISNENLQSRNPYSYNKTKRILRDRFSCFWLSTAFDHMLYFKWNLQSRNPCFNNKTKRNWGTGFHAFDFLQCRTKQNAQKIWESISIGKIETKLRVRKK